MKDVIEFELFKNGGGYWMFYDTHHKMFFEDLNLCCGCTSKATIIKPQQVFDGTYPANKNLIFKCSKECELFDGVYRSRIIVKN